jgi:NADH-quinone oxidoreductase subunit G
MSELNLIIDDIAVTVPRGMTVLQAARTAGIEIPNLCFHPHLKREGTCRICVVEVEGNKTLQASCMLEVAEGMVVKTNTEKVVSARKANLELIFSHHKSDCHHCVRMGNYNVDNVKPELCGYCFLCDCSRIADCKLQKLAVEYKINRVPYELKDDRLPLEASTSSILYDPNKCIKCRRCIGACGELQSVNALGVAGRGADLKIVPAMGGLLKDSPCVECGQCVNACPVGAMQIKEEINEIMYARIDRKKHIVAQVDSSVLDEVAELAGMENGSVNMKNLVAGLRRFGIHHIMSDGFAVNYVNKSYECELNVRLRDGVSLPLITTHCPGAVRFCETHFPNLLKNLASVKSPHQIFGQYIKTIWAKEKGISPSDIYTVCIVPNSCSSKKAEIVRPENIHDGHSNVDLVLTTREIIRLFSRTGVDMAQLEPSEFDSLGNTGNTDAPAQPLLFNAVSDHPGLFESVLVYNHQVIKIANAQSLGSAKKAFEQMEKGESHFHFIGVSACWNGCSGR